MGKSVANGRSQPAHVARRKHVLRLSLPIIGSILSYNLFNLIDIAMVGTMGHVAIAGVSLGGFVFFFVSASVMGLSAGVQGITSRRVGIGDRSGLAGALNNGLLIAIIVGSACGICLYAMTPRCFRYLVEDHDAVAVGVPYLRARLVGMCAVGCNFCFRGYWTATNRTSFYFRTMLLMNLINICLNWLLIFGKLGAPRLGATGAGIASSIAACVGTLYYFYLGFRYCRQEGFLRGKARRKDFWPLIRVSAPDALQQAFFIGGLAAMMWISGKIGTHQLAASHVVLNLLFVGMLPSHGFGIAAASLVGQALGRKRASDAIAWGWDVAKISFCVALTLSSVGFLFVEPILKMFFHDSMSLAVSVYPMKIGTLAMLVDAVGLVFLNALIGAGYAKNITMIAFTLQWVLYLPMAYFVGLKANFGFEAIWVAYLVYRVLQTVILGFIWRHGSWTRVDLFV